MSSPARRERIAVVLLLGMFFALALASSWNDSAIIDELAHIPAGYSYVFLLDYRLNPEHPPLAKDLAALPLALARVTFPTDVPSWRDDVNGQWAQGASFLYESGNDPDRMLRLMRFPLIALAVAFGWLLWAWTRRHFGPRVALLTLFLYALSPTIIAHSRYVTTDLAAMFGFFIGIVAFTRFLTEPSAKNIFIAGLAFGVAQLLKFSLILLLPVYAIFLIAWAASKIQLLPKDRIRLLGRTTLNTLGIGAVGLAVIWIVYAFHVWNYPPERQLRDAEYILTSFRFRSWAGFDLWLIGNSWTRPIGQYLLGLFMVLQRAAGGNTQYFLGAISAAGDARYFPTLYLLKETLALHILTLIALTTACARVAKAPVKSLPTVLGWIRDHFFQFGALTFIGVYWASSLSSTLNIGVRHVLPTFPFIYILVAKEIVTWLRPWRTSTVTNRWQAFRRLFDIYAGSLPRYLLVYGLLAWAAISVIVAFPHYLSYYNAFGGGTREGYRIAVDSNYDWGQDLKRLAAFSEANGIGDIRVDYFGGGSPRYYLGDTFEPWSSAKGYPPGGGWFAVSATFQMGAYGEPVEGFVRKAEDSYEWLRPFRPVARAGKSIFVYNLPPPGPFTPR